MPTNQENTALARNVPCCWSCGVPIGSSIEFVCPVCGSTSWGWKNTSLRSALFSLLGLFIFGSISWEILLSLELLSGGTSLLLYLITGVFTSSLYLIKSRKSGEDPSLPLSFCFFSFLAQFALLLAGIPSSYSFGLLTTFSGVLALDISFFWKSARPSIDKTLAAIIKRKLLLALNQKRISIELEKLEHAKKTPTLSDVEKKLKESRTIISREIDILVNDETYLSHLRVFYRWKMTLYALIKGLPTIRPDDLDPIEKLVNQLETEIQGCAKALAAEPQRLKNGSATDAEEKRCRARVEEVLEVISQSMFLHDKIREALAARRAHQILSEVDLLSSLYDVPDQGSPIIIKDLDCTSEILNRLDAGYYKIQADSSANDVLRE